MEIQLEPLFKGILRTVKTHEESIYNKVSSLEEQINNKDKQIKILEELCDKLKLEMEDFLKVSFANRWKKKAEELEKQKEHIQNKLNDIIKINGKLNSHLDKKTELISISTQTEQNDTEQLTQTVAKCTSVTSTQTESTMLEITTKKGSQYVLKNDTLFTKDGKIAGQVTNKYF